MEKGVIWKYLLVFFCLIQFLKAGGEPEKFSLSTNFQQQSTLITSLSIQYITLSTTQSTSQSSPFATTVLTNQSKFSSISVQPTPAISLLVSATAPTSPAEPNVPLNLAANATSSSSFHVAWIQPRNSHELNLTYTIKVFEEKLKKEICNFNTSNTTLDINKLEAYTNYTIVLSALNSNGVYGPSVNITQQTFEDVPGKPNTFKCRSVSSDKVFLSWKPPSETNGELIMYQIIDRSNGELHNVTMTLTNNITIKELEPHTNYTFELRAATSIGPGPNISTICKTNETEPDIPSNLTVIYIGARSFFVQWRKPVKDFGKIIDYKIDISGLPEPFNISIQASEPLHYNATNGIKAYTSYNVSVSARTSVGYGEAVQRKIKTLESTPGKPDDFECKVLSSENVSLSWQPPSEPNGELTMYQIIDKGNNKLYNVTNRSISNFIVREREPHTKYTFELRAATSIGPGPKISTFCKTNETEPDVPTNLTVIQITAHSFYIQWKEPVKNYGKIIEYKIDISGLPEPFNISIQASEPLHYNATNGLKPYTSYNVSVSARTSVGYGEAVQRKIKTLESTPGKPDDFECKVLSSENVSLSWQPPSEPNGELTMYQIIDKGNNKLYNVTNRSISNFIVREREPHTKYTFELRAATSIGPGPKISTFCKTNETEPDVPTNLTVIQITAHSFYIQWKEPVKNYGKIIEYKIDISGLPEPFNISIQASEPLHYNATNGLKPYTSYNVSVSARTSVGYGEAVQRKIKTLESTPGKPDDFECKVLSSENVSLSWQPPSEPNGELTMYQIIDKGNNKLYNVTNRSISNFIVREREPHTKYTFELRAATSIGPGPKISTFCKTNETEPDVPTNLTVIQITAHSFYIQWKEPVKNYGKIIEYKIDISGLPESFNISIQASEPLHYNATNGIKPYTSYNVSVSARTSVGYGEAVQRKIKTLESTPGKPDDFECKVLSSENVSLSWQPPSEPNGELTMYQIIDKGNNKLYNVTNRSISNFIVREREPHTKYTFELRAATSIGPGPKISTFCKTNETEPDVPTNLTVTQITAHSFYIQWKEPVKNYGKIIEYKIDISDFPEPLSILASEPLHYYVTNGVKPYTSYNVSVSAKTSVGYGEAVVKEIKTMESTPLIECEIVVVNKTSRTIDIRWNEPTTPNGIVFYKLTVDGKVESESDENRFVWKELSPFTQYNLFVQACTRVGCAQPCVRNVTTDSEKPGTAPEIKDVVTINNSSIKLTWSNVVDEYKHGIITKFVIKYNDEKNSYNDTIVLTEDVKFHNIFHKVIENLRPFTRYCFQVKAGNDRGYSDFSPKKCNKTKDGRPGPVREIKFKSLSKLTDMKKDILVSWNVPLKANGIISRYKITVSDGSELHRAHGTNITLEKRDPFTLYIFTITPFTSLPGISTSMNYTTEPAPPSGRPQDFKTEALSKSIIRLSWKPPVSPNGEIKGYNISYRRSNYRDEKVIYISAKPLSFTNKKNVEGLNPFTEYMFRMSCESSGGIGEYTKELPGKTKEAVPMRPLSTPKPLEGVTRETITIRLWKPTDAMGVIKYFYIFVLESTHTTEKYRNKISLDTTYDDYIKQREHGEISSPYVTGNITRAQYDEYNGTFVIGTDQETRRRRDVVKYRNGPLFDDTSYFVFFRAHINEELYAESKGWLGPYTTKVIPKADEDPVVGAIVGVIAGIIVVLVIAAAVFYCKRRTGSFTSEGARSVKDIQNEGYMPDCLHTPNAQPVLLDNFSPHVRNLSKDGKYLFSEEFKMILNGQNGNNCLYEHSNHPINREKNRYNNIVAYDHTRVLLESIEGIPESDYVNANYIDGYMKQAAYIATQGPLENTCEDFWRMCWEKNVSNIVMLTGLVENGRIKCHQYWPDVGSTCYGVMQVTLTESRYLPMYAIRTFSLLHDQYPGHERFVHHYAFCAWPDHGVPNSQQLLTFIRRVNQETTEGTGPSVVHCSAGVGRTGTFILLDVNLRRIEAEGNIEIYNYLSHIRSQRNHMVQTEAQYVFIHDALLEQLAFGVTEVQSSDLREYVKRLQQPLENGVETLADKEFQKLNLFDQSASKTMNAANAPFNKTKNRFLNVLPYDDTRVALRQLAGINGSDYINANYVNGYSTARLFIATQAPLPQTIPAFWRMVWEHQSMTIVCLAQETENGKVKIHRYWPSIEAAMHGTLMIENVAEDIRNDFIVRDFKVTHITEGQSRDIRHFQFTGWPDNSHPDSGSNFVDMIGRVQKWHQQNGVGQIVVHCSAGVGRTGVFISLCNLIERVRIEGIVDVFQAVRELRTQRPAMVQTKIEYMFCYLALQDFLASFDIYQNFM